jgi:hypothetical protein
MRVWRNWALLVTVLAAPTGVQAEHRQPEIEYIGGGGGEAGASLFVVDRAHDRAWECHASFCVPLHTGTFKLGRWGDWYRTDAAIQCIDQAAAQHSRLLDELGSRRLNDEEEKERREAEIWFEGQVKKCDLTHPSPYAPPGSDAAPQPDR